MNHELIKEYLSETKSPVQLVKHFDEVIDKHKQWPMAAQLKKDGVYALVVVVDGDIQTYGRTGLKLYWEVDFLLNHMDYYMLPDGVYIAELVCPDCSLEVLSGYVNPNRKKLWVEVDDDVMNSADLWFHDYLTFDELLGGHSERPYMQRFGELMTNLHVARKSNRAIEYFLMNSEEEVQGYADKAIADGEEGVVLKRLDADWVAGHKGYRAMKIVRGVSLDLRCTGVLMGKGKREGQIAAFEFEYKGSKFKADLGKGWTDERRARLTHDYNVYQSYVCSDDCFKATLKSYNPIGQIWEVKALDISSTGKALRLPKVVRVRWDKDEPDA